jgi:hypothetical protein
VRLLHATSTTDTLVRYVQDAVGESYTEGFRHGYRRREDTSFRLLLWRCLRRSVRRLVRRMLSH